MPGDGADGAGEVEVGNDCFMGTQTSVAGRARTEGIWTCSLILRLHVRFVGTNDVGGGAGEVELGRDGLAGKQKAPIAGS